MEYSFCCVSCERWGDLVGCFGCVTEWNRTFRQKPKVSYDVMRNTMQKAYFFIYTSQFQDTGEEHNDF